MTNSLRRLFRLTQEQTHLGSLVFCFPNNYCEDGGTPQTDALPFSDLRTTGLLQSLSSFAAQFSSQDISVLGWSQNLSTDFQKEFSERWPLLDLINDTSGAITTALHLWPQEFPWSRTQDTPTQACPSGSEGQLPLMMFFATHNCIEKVFYPIALTEHAGEIASHWMQNRLSKRQGQRPVHRFGPSADRPILLRRDPYTLTNLPGKMTAHQASRLLAKSHWAQNRTPTQVNTSLQYSECFGVYTGSENDSLVAMARVISDRATFAYLCDVIVDPIHQGRGLSTWMLDTIMNLSWIQGLKRFLLFSRDAQGLYRKYGFEKPHEEDINRLMILLQGQKS